MKDKFLKEQIKEDDGWVKTEVMFKLKRLAELTTENGVLFTALKKSNAGLIELDEGGERLRRFPTKPLPADSKEARDEISSRTVYAKRFPLDVTLEQMQEFFGKYGTVDSI